MYVYICWLILPPASIKQFKSLTLWEGGFCSKGGNELQQSGLSNPTLYAFQPHSLFTPDSFKLKL